MVRISQTEFKKEVERFQDVALKETVVVTRGGHDRTVMISSSEYRRLKRRDREVLGLGDFTRGDLEAIRRAEPPADTAQFDDELT
ncbi:MAG: type II toxin-antitoxin system Phd/YefM family antitoxin [Caulobacteraceae bacterium]|nr:type II toxin-antitoxin system Phd/YefM family antitoxin [Caulobacteraceae bacterium]